MKKRGWRTSSYSGNQGDCVEVVLESERVQVRDTKDRRAGEIAVQPAGWAAFLTAVSAID